MGGTETTGVPVRRSLLDARRAPPGVAAGAQISRSGGGGRGGDSMRYVGARGEGTSDHQRRDDGWDGGKGDNQVGEGGRAIPTSVLIQGHHRGGGLASSGPDPERGIVLL